MPGRFFYHITAWKYLGKCPFKLQWVCDVDSNAFCSEVCLWINKRRATAAYSLTYTGSDRLVISP